MEISNEYGEKHHQMLFKKTENESNIKEAKENLFWLMFVAPLANLFSLITLVVVIDLTVSNPMTWPALIFALGSLFFPGWTNVSLFKNIRKIIKSKKEIKNLDKQIEFEEIIHNGVEITEENINDKVIEKNIVSKPKKLQSNNEENDSNFTL